MSSRESQSRTSVRSEDVASHSGSVLAKHNDWNDENKHISPQDRGWVKPTPTDYAAFSAQAIDEQSTKLKPQWLSQAVKYEWNGDYGEVMPPLPELEEQLFRAVPRPHIGEWFNVYRDYSVATDPPQLIKPIDNFVNAGLHPTMVENVRLSQYSLPTPIQAYTVPAILQGLDVIAIAQTGSGKTAGYFIPVLSKLMGKASKLAARRPDPSKYNAFHDAIKAEPLVIVVCPTRELGLQIFDEARRLCYRSMLRPCVVYGGGPRRVQMDDLRLGCDILIGTPGRLKDIIENEPHWISLNRVKFTIIDEADEMLGTDWESELKPILGGGLSQDDADHQFMMFSATFPGSVRALAKTYLADDHVKITVGRAGSTHDNIQQRIFQVEEDKKKQFLKELILKENPGRTLIFVNSVRKVEELDRFLFRENFPVVGLSSDRLQSEREDAIHRFRTGMAPILVSTAATARGIDVLNLMHVINYDLPSIDHGGIREYVHRIGRTARIGNRGMASSFYTERDEPLAEQLTKLLIESKQNVPAFLEHYRPDGAIEWDDTSDMGDDIGADGHGAGWATDEVNGGTDAWAPSTADTQPNDDPGKDSDFFASTGGDW